MKVLSTKVEYEEALAEIERLWRAKPGTPEAERGEMLVILVVQYEEEHYPILPPDSIEAIKFRLDQMKPKTVK